jgi:DNA adenine methylase
MNRMGRSGASAFLSPVAGRSFLKWAGGKRQLLSDILPMVPDFQNYVEPFLGGGAVFFALSSARPGFRAILGDSNAPLIQTYRVVMDNPAALVDLLFKHELEYNADPEGFYYSLRDQKPSDSLSTAARFIALNRTCYNGLYRVNSKGEFNVPMGRYRNPKICNRDVLVQSSAALRGCRALLLNEDYERVASLASKGDFVYLDPPFAPESRTANFVGYTSSGFGEREQQRLAKVFHMLDGKGCNVLLSNSDTPVVRDLYSGFSSTTARVPALRSINSVGARRTSHSELLIRNYRVNW